MKKFKSQHNLKVYVNPFTVAGIDAGVLQFKIGTTHGIFKNFSLSVDVFTVINDNPGNGHMEDFFEFFEAHAKKTNRVFRMCEVSDQEFKNALILRGFKATEHPEILMKDDFLTVKKNKTNGAKQ